MTHLMRTPVLRRIALAVMTVWVGAAHAVGLGSISVQSALGQPLKVTIPLIGADSTDLVSSCIKSRIESSDGVFINVPSVTLVRSGQAQSVHLSTRQAIDEPAVTVAIELTCGSQVRREFQILLDPVAAGSLLATVDASAAMPMPDLRTALEPRSSRIAADRQTLDTKKRKAAAVDGPAGAIALAASSRLAPAGNRRNVLKLSSESLTREDLAALGRLKLSSTMAAAPATDNPAQSEEIRSAQSRFALVLRGEDPWRNAEQARVAAQTQITALKKQSALVARQRAANQVELEAMRQDSFSVAWIVGLMGLLLTSLIAVVWLTRRLMEARKASAEAPWDMSLEQVDTVAATTSVAAVSDLVVSHEPLVAPTSGLFASGKKPSVDLASVPEFLRTLSEPDTRPPEPPVVSVVKTAPAAGTSEVTSLDMQFYPAQLEHMKVEEISDVMQEAEFWMSLSDPQRAIQILELYGDADEPDSPVPWLYLLDLYRGVGERAKYDALRERIGKVFNALIPEWDDDSTIANGRTLEDFPHLVQKICDLWETDRIVPYLESLMLDDRDGLRQGFDLAVYQEIMLLSTMARSFDRSALTNPFSGKQQLAME